MNTGILATRYPHQFMSRHKNKEFDSGFTLYYALYDRRDDAYDYVYQKVYPRFSKWVKWNNGNEEDAHDVLVDELVKFGLDVETNKYPPMESRVILDRIKFYCKRKWKSQLVSARLKKRGEMAEEPIDTTDLQKDLEWADMVEHLKKALGKLKADCRQLLEWFYIDDLSQREIAQMLNMEETSVKQKKYNCFKELRSLFLPT